ncbi:MAG TPA: PHP domain-containing protein [Kineosporiaceae bacterium]|nr:PHP domain-containing protein [Kineosporiaceae bacterium]
MLIDLHAHSTASDGVDTPAELVAAAVAAGLDVVALTDHDSTAGWEEALAAAEHARIQLVPGLEISCRMRGISVHLLSYRHDPADAALHAELTATRHDRVDRARRMVHKISVDYPLTWEDVLEHVPAGATVGRPHIADAMIAQGLVTDRDEAFETTLHRNSPYYEPHYAPSAVDAVRLVVAAGGVPVMAHPRAGRRGRVVTDEDIAELAAAGLAGLEADHPDHDPQERAAVRSLAADLGLLTTGSSDYHGAVRSHRLGSCTTQPQVLEAILAAGHGLDR